MQYLIATRQGGLTVLYVATGTGKADAIDGFYRWLKDACDIKDMPSVKWAKVLPTRIGRVTALKEAENG